MKLVTCYEAFDGTDFKTKDACVKYEEAKTSAMEQSHLITSFFVPTVSDSDLVYIYRFTDREDLENYFNFVLIPSTTYDEYLTDYLNSREAKEVVFPMHLAILKNANEGTLCPVNICDLKKQAKDMFDALANIPD